jgi:hypothetical protein
VLLRLNLPELPSGATRVKIGRWLTAIDEPVAFGDVVLEISVQQRDWIRRPKRAADIVHQLGHDVPGGRVVIEPEVVDHIANTVYEVVASDTGVLRAQLASEGQLVEASAPLAVVTTEAGEPLDEMTSEPLPFRAVVQLVEMGPDDLRYLE